MDSHTLLVNKSLSLSRHRVNTRWPKILLDLGYDIHGIESSVHVPGGNVSPDIILTSSRLCHALAIDCKSGANVDLEQDLRYRQMSTSDLHRTGMPAFARSHVAIYAINEEHVERIRAHTNLALLVFGRRRIYGIGDFGNAELARELRRGVPLETGSFPDLEIYPFSIRDTQRHIDGHVSRAVLGHLRVNPGIVGRSLATRADAGAILREAHPLHALFSGPHRSELRRAVARSVARQEGRGAWWFGPAGRRGMQP